MMYDVHLRSYQYALSINVGGTGSDLRFNCYEVLLTALWDWLGAFCW